MIKKLLCIYIIIIFLPSYVFSSDSEYQNILDMQEGISDLSLANRSGNLRNSYLSVSSPFIDIRYTGLIDNISGSLDGTFLSLHSGIPLSDSLLFSSLSLNYTVAPLYSELSFVAGIGIKKRINANSAFSLSFDSVIAESGIGLFGDLGIYLFADDFLLFKNMRIGLCLDNFGWTNYSGTSYITDPFTFRLSADSELTSWDWGRIDYSAGIALPGFSQFRFDFGILISMFDIVSLETNISVDTEDLANSDFSSLLPDIRLAFSIPFRNFRLKLKAGWDMPRQNYSAVHSEAAITFARADTEPPVISHNLYSDIYLSPNGDSVSDTVSADILLEDNSELSGSVIEIRDSEGNTVLGSESSWYDDHKNILKNIFTEQDRKIREIIFSWDGTDKSGEILPDGVYSLVVTAEDSEGNSGVSEFKKIILDTTPPSLSIDTGSSLSIFSPNGDGNQDLLSVQVNAVKDESWTAIIRDSAGNTVYTGTGLPEFSGPSVFIWNGITSDGSNAGDGEYYVVFKSADLAGNGFTSEKYTFIIDSGISSVSIENDLDYVSPNSDGIMDIITFTMSAADASKIISHSFSVYDSSRNLVNKTEKNGPVEKKLELNTSKLKDGVYIACLEVRYINGARPVAYSREFTVDTTPPKASLRADSLLFTPDGDGIDDEMVIYQETSTEDEWRGVIEDEDGFVIDSFAWSGNPEEKLVWDGYGKFGFPLQEGKYRYRIFAEDRSGNKGSSNTIHFELSAGKTDIQLITSTGSFSPNNDGAMDSITIIPRSQRTLSVKSFEFTVLDSRDSIIYSSIGSKVLPQSFIWNGLTTSGLPVKDGEYRARLSVEYSSGGTDTSISRSFTVDTVFPDIKLSADLGVFSPNFDGKNDVLRIKQNSNEKLFWTGIIYCNNDKKIREWYWNGLVSDLYWDGTDGNNIFCKDGEYRYEISASDNAGNGILKILKPIVIDTSSIEGSVKTSASVFSPSGDPGTVIYTINMSQDEGVKSWNFIILNQEGTSRKTFSGEGSMPKQITWNGVNDLGKKIEGFYTAQFTVSFTRGDVINLASPSVELDLTPPLAEISLTPVIFTEKDGKTELKANIGGIAEKVNIKFETDSGTFQKSEFINIDPGTNSIRLNLVLKDSLVRYPSPVTIFADISDAPGNLKRYKMTLLLDIKLEKYAKGIYISADSADHSSWNNSEIDPREFVSERLQQIFSVNNPELVLIKLPAAWLLYSEKPVEAAGSNSTALSRKIVDYLSKAGYKKDLFKVISSSEAEKLYSSIRE